MTNKYKIGIGIVLLVGVVAFALGSFKLEAQSAKPGEEKPTIILKGQPATDEEREYSKRYRKVYPNHPFDLNKLIETGKKQRTDQVVGSSLGVPEVPTVEGSVPLSDHDFLVDLSCTSDSVLVGTVKAQSAHLTDDGGLVYTQYQFAVSEILRNIPVHALDVGEDVQITRPGGFIKIENQRIRIEDQSFPALKTGGKYLIFLEFLPLANGYVSTKLGGTFNLNNGAVKTLAGRRLSSLPLDDAEIFLKLVQSVQCQKTKEERDD